MGDAAHMLVGTAAQMACIVLPQLLTVHLLPRRLLLLRWLPTSNVMELSAQEDAVHMLDGTAAQMVCTVLPLLLTVHMPKITFRNLLQSHLVSPGLEGVLEHLGVNLALVVV